MEPEQQIMEFTNLLLEAMKLAIKIANDREIEKFNLTNATMANVGNVQGITAQFTDGTNVSPTIYPSQYMEAYQNGTSIDELAQRAIQTLKDGHNAMPTFDVESINPENAQSQLYMVILNKEMNKEIAEKCPHIEIQDLIAVPRWRVSQGDGEQASILVTHDIQSRLLHMTDDEVCGIAKSNTLSEGFTVQGITEVMMQIMGGDMPEEFLADMLPEEEPIYDGISYYDNGSYFVVMFDTYRRSKE